MDKYKVLVTAPPILPNIDEYRSACFEAGIELITPDTEVKESLNAKELNQYLKGMDAILCGDDELNKNSIDKQIDGEDKKFNNTESLKEQISDNKKFIKNKIDEQGKIKKTYTEYISRFKKLKGL